MDLFISILSSDWLIILLLVAFASETLLVHLKARKYLEGSPSKDERNQFNEIRAYSEKAITLAGIVFAIIAIVPSLNKDESINFLEVILFFTIALFMFLLCFKLDVIAAKKRKYWDIQQRLFNYGFLTVIVGINKYFDATMKDLLPIIIPLSLLFFLIHFFEFIGDLRVYTLEESKVKQ